MVLHMLDCQDLVLREREVSNSFIFACPHAAYCLCFWFFIKYHQITWIGTFRWRLKGSFRRLPVQWKRPCYIHLSKIWSNLLLYLVSISSPSSVSLNCIYLCQIHAVASLTKLSHVFEIGPRERKCNRRVRILWGFDFRETWCYLKEDVIHYTATKKEQ